MRGLGILAMFMAGLLMLGVFAAGAGLIHVTVVGGGQACMGLVGGKPSKENNRRSAPVQVSPVRRPTLGENYHPWVAISVTEREHSTSTVQRGVLTLYTVSRGLDLMGTWKHKDQQGNDRRVELIGYFSDPYGRDKTEFHLETVAGSASGCENNTDEERHTIDGAIDLRAGVIVLSEWRHSWCTDEPLFEDRSEFRSKSSSGAVNSETAPVE